LSSVPNQGSVAVMGKSSTFDVMAADSKFTITAKDATWILSAAMQ
jgi:hypothetical protein